MPAQVTNYQCPDCTAPLHFAGKSGKLECDYCGKTYDVSEIETLYEEKNKKAQEAAKEAEEKASSGRDGEWDFSSAGAEWGEDAAGMRAYSCPSCGAELLCDETTAATSCPYCGNPTVIPGQFSGVKKPDLVQPFKLDKAAAVEALKKHYNGKFFLPKTFKSLNHIEEVKGVYVPFWLFDGDVDADVTFAASRTHSHRHGNTETIITDHYQVRREGTFKLEKLPVDASSKMPDDYMDSIEPFDYSDIKPFSMAYLPGFLADKYDVSIEDCAVRAERRAHKTGVDCMRNTVVGYETCVPEAENVVLRRGKVRYAMLPVWLLSTKWKDKNFLFAMNGQTGKMIGDLPVDRRKYWLTFGGIAAALTAIFAVSGIAGALGSTLMGMFS